jgi:hypothetical protein
LSPQQSPTAQLVAITSKQIGTMWCFFKDLWLAVSPSLNLQQIDASSEAAGAWYRKHFSLPAIRQMWKANKPDQWVGILAIQILPVLRTRVFASFEFGITMRFRSTF